MKRTISTLLFAALMLITTASSAHEKFKDKVDACHLTLFNNQTYIPFLGMGNIVNSKWHPGIATGLVFDGKERKRYMSFTTVNVGFFHHRFIQAGLQIYGSRGIDYRINEKFSIVGTAGAGYLHSVTLHKTFVADENGNYTVSGRLGRPQAMIALSGGLGYNFRFGSRSAQCQLTYQPWMQFPFIKSYVPLLPNNALQFAVRYNLKSSILK